MATPYLIQKMLQLNSYPKIFLIKIQCVKNANDAVTKTMLQFSSHQIFKMTCMKVPSTTKGFFSFLTHFALLVLDSSYTYLCLPHFNIQGKSFCSYVTSSDQVSHKVLRWQLYNEFKTKMRRQQAVLYMSISHFQIPNS